MVRELYDCYHFVILKASEESEYTHFVFSD